MPELKRPEFSERGSTLVTVVAFAGILAIAICGFLGVARTMTNQENIEMNDDKAFLAAESGLFIGTRWLRDTSNWFIPVFSTASALRSP
jgi:Tfp pilus assembly protein PilX